MMPARIAPNVRLWPGSKCGERQGNFQQRDVSKHKTPRWGGCLTPRRAGCLVRRAYVGSGTGLGRAKERRGGGRYRMPWMARCVPMRRRRTNFSEENEKSQLSVRMATSAPCPASSYGTSEFMVLAKSVGLR